MTKTCFSFLEMQNLLGKGDGKSDTLRIQDGNIAKALLDWNPQGKKKKGNMSKLGDGPTCKNCSQKAYFG